MSLSAAIKISLIDINPDLDVYVKDRVAYIRGKVSLAYGDKLISEIHVNKIEGIKDLKISISSKFLDV